MTAEFFTKPINFHLEIEAKGPFKRTITYEGKQYSGNDATELIESFDVDDYFRIFGMLQDEPDIASLSAGAARWYIEKLLNFNYDDQLNVIKSEIEDLENNEDTMMKSITVNETIISSSANRIKEMEQPRYTDDQISRAKSLQKTLKEKLKTHDDQVAAKQKVDTALREAETQLSSVRSRLVKEEQRMSQYASLDTALKAAQEELSRRCDEALSMHAAYDDAVEAQENLEELDDYEKAEKAAETKKNKIMSQIETFKRYKSSIDEGVCPHCGQETTQHAADLLIKDFGSDDVAVIKKQLDADLKKATDEYS
jgi:DNA repair exonuclease SbcCD ATPase subunit